MSKFLVLLSFCVTLLSLSTTAQAGSAQLLLDARTGEVLASENPDELNHPASLTKMMSVYMVLEAIKSGNLTWDSKVPFSKYASARPPTKLRVKAGDEITVKEAVLAMIVLSANDVAAAVGEKLGGTERNFGNMMTRKARELGMVNTTFYNASGLPHPDQFTTARDMSTLGVALIRDFPKDYALFSTKSFEFRGRTINGHNNLMYRYKGMDGIKTGYTNASGFNLVSAVEHDGRRVVGVVLGGRTAASRDKIMEKLIDAHIGKAVAGEELMVSREIKQNVDVARISGQSSEDGGGEDALSALQKLAGITAADEPKVAAAYAPARQNYKAVAANAQEPLQVQTPAAPVAQVAIMDKWQVQIAASDSAQGAMQILKEAREKIGAPLENLDTYTEAMTNNGVTYYRARFTGFETKDKARAICEHLVRQRYDCVLMPARG
ncbi:D-alanyl-D-alanine carboxypeptidase family protein [Peteryoungia ipomoeae]|uniref:D-alanyl-D-alanine carboxypeptidase n=1 Tax=Peteryoungia ipomoeae TaxID=1210932 RepID=A0A4S8P5W6_9HYPH|nr:D-alanyl-D-alanine carboxypeptidase family protein [Peteryoungia ipomoeae]THV23139.1 D-alanyl-D-alanine carboxypeptidase [Peteryoungia ipomoeae]